jgi:hypothetical protein
MKKLGSAFGTGTGALVIFLSLARASSITTEILATSVYSGG